MRAAMLVLVAACASARPTLEVLVPPDAAVDAAPDALPALPDAAPDAAPPGPCFETRLLGPLCLAVAPSAPLALAGAVDTSRDCTEVRPQAGAVELCIVSATDLEVLAGAVATVTGSRALVLVATRRIAVAGALVARSGARDPVACAPAGGATLVDGFSPVFNRAGGGGGAGGSYRIGPCPVTATCSNGNGADGGRGGNPVQSTNQGAGIAVSVPVPPGLVGGCRGGFGGGDSAGATAGAAGAAGGAVYLVAGESIAVTGRIDASGSPGGAGSGPGGSGNGGGGGGGGSGGAIALDAPSIDARTAQLVVDGGSGGAGGPGVNSVGGGRLAGGAGGTGAALVAPAGPGGGGEPSSCSDACSGAGGGGGGGGLGSVQTFIAAPSRR